MAYSHTQTITADILRRKVLVVRVMAGRRRVVRPARSAGRGLGLETPVLEKDVVEKYAPAPR